MNLWAKVAGTETTRRAYPSGVTNDERAFLLPYLLRVREDAGQRPHHGVSGLTLRAPW